MSAVVPPDQVDALVPLCLRFPDVRDGAGVRAGLHLFADIGERGVVHGAGADDDRARGRHFGNQARELRSAAPRFEPVAVAVGGGVPRAVVGRQDDRREHLCPARLREAVLHCVQGAAWAAEDQVLVPDGFVETEEGPAGGTGVAGQELRRQGDRVGVARGPFAEGVERLRRPPAAHVGHVERVAAAVAEPLDPRRSDRGHDAGVVVADRNAEAEFAAVRGDFDPDADGLAAEGVGGHAHPAGDLRHGWVVRSQFLPRGGLPHRGGLRVPDARQRRGGGCFQVFGFPVT